MHTRIRGIKRVRKRLADGSTREYHYVRGTPVCVWTSESPYRPGSPEYLAAIAEAARPLAAGRPTLSGLISEFLESAEWADLAERTRRDYRRHLLRIERAFGDTPLAAVEDPRFRTIALQWRDRIDGRREADLAMTVLARVIAWALDRGKLRTHQLRNTKRRWRGEQRAEMIWTTAEAAAMRAALPAHTWRAFSAALETGLRPGDLVALTLDSVETTPAGRRIVLRTRKRGRVAAVPVTETMAGILDTTPAAAPGEPAYVLRQSRGEPWTAGGLSQAVMKGKRAAGITRPLRLYDARGTACVRWLSTGACDLRTIATIMGWDYSTASHNLASYAALDPTLTDRVLAALG